MEVAFSPGLCETVRMPKDRKKTFSDHQAEASRAKKQPKKKESAREDLRQAPAPMVKATTKN